MMDKRTEAVMAYLDTAEPKGEPWSYEDARRWIETEVSPQAQGLRAALDICGV